MVSHELRAPLTSIKGSAATVLRASRLFGPGRGGAVLPHHRGAGRPHGQPDRRPARRRAHRRRHAVGRARALRGRRAGGPGPRHVHQRRRAAHRPHRPAARPAPGHGRPAAHGAGAQQPARQRRAPVSGVRPHPGRGGARGTAGGGLGLRRGPGHRAGPSRPAVPQVHRRRGPGERRRRRAGTRHLQGSGRGPWRAHPGRERRRRARRALHLHDPGGRGVRRPCAGGRTPSPSYSASSPSTTTGAGSAWPGAR